MVSGYLVADDQMKSRETEVNSKAISFLQTQVDSGITINKALGMLLERYPEHSSSLVMAALKAYPNRYEEILKASISVNPSFIDEIIMVAIEANIADTTEIVEIAISADPSYAEDVTKAACKYNPDYFKEIIRVAVHTEPDSADQIAKKLVKAYPSRTFEILITAMKEVPLVGKYVLDALLATVDENDEETSSEMIIISVEQLAQHPDAIARLIALAQQHEVDELALKESAIKGGLDEKTVTALIEQYYNQ